MSDQQPDQKNTATMHENTLEVDTCGLMCPEPVMMLHQAIRKIDSGQQLHVIATDPSTQRDIPKFCLHLGHELVSQETKNSQTNEQNEVLETFHYVIQKS